MGDDFVSFHAEVVCDLLSKAMELGLVADRMRVTPHTPLYEEGRGDFNRMLGCLGEFAASLRTGLFWNGADFFGADIGELGEVRTRWDPNGTMGVKPTDHEGLYILVTRVEFPKLWHTVGWIDKATALRVGDRKDPPGAKTPVYYVPRRLLRPMDEFASAHEIAVAATRGDTSASGSALSSSRTLPRAS